MPHPIIRRLLIPLATAALILAVWLGTHASNESVSSDPVASEAPKEQSPVPLLEEPIRTETSATETVATSPSRREVVDGVMAIYRKLQLTRELDLEQRRYRAAYWQSEPSDAELAALRPQRDALLKRLSEEATRAVASYFPSETIEPITFAALFNDEHPGPNISYLSADSRQRFEAELLADDGLTASRFEEIATRTLLPTELDLFRKWNDQAAVALRHQLVGFEATEAEFNAVLQKNRALAETGEANGAVFALEFQLGRDRSAQFAHLNDPAVQTAVHDLHRTGIPISNAEWLAATRLRAVEEIQQVWQNVTLSDPAKAQQVSTLDRQYGQLIDAKLGLRGSSVDEIGKSP